jgi:hypothetical protein
MNVHHKSREALNIRSVNGRVIIQASNIHQGSGRTLLLPLLEMRVGDQEGGDTCDARRTSTDRCEFGESDGGGARCINVFWKAASRMDYR